MGYPIAALAALALGFAAYRACVAAFGDREAERAEREAKAEKRKEARRPGGRAPALAAAVNRVLPIGKSDSDEYRNLLAAAGVKADPETWHGVTVASLAAGVIASSALLLGTDRGPTTVALYTALGTLFGWGLPRLYLSLKTKKRRKDIEADLPDAISLLGIAVDAGVSAEAGFRKVSEEYYGPVAEEFSRVDRDINMLSIGKAEALRRMADRCQCQTVSMFSSALIQAWKQGSPLSRILEGQANNARKAWNAELMAKANRIPTLITFPLIFCFVPCSSVLVGVPLVVSALQTLTSLGGM